MDAAYLLPHLRPGWRLLDVGCGPGTITAGLARIVVPGSVVGVDLEPGVLGDAAAHVATTPLTNVGFAQASAYALPCDEATFDTVHAHQVLQHLAQPEEAAREVFRVLRPGGLFGVREADYATMLHWPPTPGIDRWLALYHDVAHRNGAEPDAGRRLPSWLQAAGFDRVTVSATTVVHWEHDAVANWGESWAERVTRSAFAAQAREYRLATPSELALLADAWRGWTEEPGAFFMYVNVECVAMKPG
jgi:SAM-dependent methyltransferase